MPNRKTKIRKIVFEGRNRNSTKNRFGEENRKEEENETSLKNGMKFLTPSKRNMTAFLRISVRNYSK